MHFTSDRGIHIAPDPGFARFNGTHERVVRSMKVFGGVLVLGRVTASYMTAFETEPEMHPSIPDLHAILANMDFRARGSDLIEMGA